MTQPSKDRVVTVDQLEALVSRLDTRVTAIETTLAEKMPGFEAVSERVAQLSSAFQAANMRLAELERVAAIFDASRLEQIEARLAQVEARPDNPDRGSGQIGSRLARIEDKIDQLLPPPPPPESETNP